MFCPTLSGGADAPLTGVMLFSAVLNVLMLTSSVYMLQVYDRVLTSGSIETLLYLTIIAAAALLLLSLLDTLRSRMLDRVSNWLEMRVRPVRVPQGARRQSLPTRLPG